MLAWFFFDTPSWPAGVVTLILSLVWRKPDLLLNITFSSFDLIGNIIVQELCIDPHISLQRPLVMLNWLLLVNGIAILFVGTYIWFFTLHERNNYHKVFGMQSNVTRIAVQDTFMCCGYFGATDEVAFGGTFCPNVTAAMKVNNFCVTPITKFADTKLNDVLQVSTPQLAEDVLLAGVSTMYGFMAIVIGLFLANMCVIKKRQEEDRFEKIDAKRGGTRLCMKRSPGVICGLLLLTKPPLECILSIFYRFSGLFVL
ncbi:hypothetical protein J3R82DRAFT_5300 [Butyriboletus roseoflavus]|nr:hypothetical protein J3R82DRAFT_5300 [Butyriboletus roseoflavus]